MDRRLVRILWSMAVGILSSANTGLAQQHIEWNIGDGATARGSACSNQDTAFIQAGNEISVIFSRLGVALTGEAGGRKVVRKQCTLAIPARVAANRYLGQLDECLVWGYVQNGNSQGWVRVFSTFMGTRQSIRRRVDRRSRSRQEPYLEAASSRNIAHGRFCNGRPTMAHYRARIDMSARRDSKRDDIVLQIDGLDIKLQISGATKSCPSRRWGSGHSRSVRRDWWSNVRSASSRR